MAEVDLEKETTGIIAEMGFETEIERLRGAIEAWIDTTSDELKPALRWQFSGSSKYYRPLTVFACYRALHGPAIPETIIQAAVAVAVACGETSLRPPGR